MSVKLDKIFDSFAKNSIFKNKFILQSNYSPETIQHRDKEIRQVASILAPCLRLERPSNLFIYGKTKDNHRSTPMAISSSRVGS